MIDKTKRVPFDIERAKQGAKLVTRSGRSVRIVDYNVKNDFPILALIGINDKEIPKSFTNTGKDNIYDEENSYDLFIEEELADKVPRMTNQQLSWWLREHPEEHREYHLEGESCVCFTYHYSLDYADEEVDEHIRIRRNGGAWELPLITILESDDNWVIKL